MQHPTSAYIHIPFCAAKCGYCDFNSYAGLMPLAQRYVDALCKQIASTDPGADSEKLHTVFFGGGTPSILQAQHLVTILDTIRQAFGFADGSEITMEANPESATLDKLQRTRDAGFNRVSMGAQSFT
ncbi:MAG: radical SAM protein, partial [Armatimonadota bacterium]